MAPSPLCTSLTTLAPAIWPVPASLSLPQDSAVRSMIGTWVACPIGTKVIAMDEE